MFSAFLFFGGIIQALSPTPNISPNYLEIVFHSNKYL